MPTPSPVQPTLNDEAIKTDKTDESRKHVLNNLLSYQTYTCLLLPHFPETLISPELARTLGEQMAQIASVFGWQLENIEIRSEYLLWTVQVLPAVSATNMVRLIRQRTSRRLFTQFPQLTTINDSGDFWAPGYLAVGGSNPPNESAIKDFIAQTRRRQELLKALEA